VLESLPQKQFLIDGLHFDFSKINLDCDHIDRTLEYLNLLCLVSENESSRKQINQSVTLQILPKSQVNFIDFPSSNDQDQDADIIVQGLIITVLQNDDIDLTKINLKLQEGNKIFAEPLFRIKCLATPITKTTQEAEVRESSPNLNIRVPLAQFITRLVYKQDGKLQVKIFPRSKTLHLFIPSQSDWEKVATDGHNS